MWSSKTRDTIDSAHEFRNLCQKPHSKIKKVRKYTIHRISNFVHYLISTQGFGDGDRSLHRSRCICEGYLMLLDLTRVLFYKCGYITKVTFYLIQIVFCQLSSCYFRSNHNSPRPAKYRCHTKIAETIGELWSEWLLVEYTFLNKNIPNYYDSSVCKTRKWLHLRRDVRPVKVGLKIAIIKKFDRGKVMYKCCILRRKLFRKCLAKTYHVYTLARMPLNTTMSIRTKRWVEL